MMKGLLPSRYGPLLLAVSSCFAQIAEEAKMSPVPGRSAMKPTFSTLEVDIRGPHSTLDVNPRQYSTGLEVKPADPKSPGDLVEDPQQYPGVGQTKSPEKPWYKRYWLAILVPSIKVTGGIIGSAVGGTLASNNDSNSRDGTEKIPTESSLQVTSTLQSTQSQTPSLDSSSTVIRSTIKPTSTPGPNDSPQLPIYIGQGENGEDKLRLAFAMDSTRAPWCTYQTLPDSANPCGRPFTLSDGFEYAWNGYGGDTWATWRNPSGDDTKYRTLLTKSCEWKPDTFKCGNVFVKPEWLCGSSTS